MNRTITATCCMLALLAAPAIARGASPAETSSEDADVHEANLAVDTSGTGSGGPVIQRRIEERAAVVLRRLAVVPGDASSPTIRILVSDLEADQPGYGLELRLTRASGQLVQSRSIVCALCTESELVDRAETEIEGLVPLLADLQPSDDTTSRSTTMTPPTPETDPPPDSTPPPARANPLIKSGAALLAVGVVGVGVGLGLALAPPRTDAEDPRYFVTTQRPGFAVLGVGAALAVTGAVLTGLGVKRRNDAGSRRADRPSTRVAVSFDKSHVGVTLGGRF